MCKHPHQTNAVGCPPIAGDAGENGRIRELPVARFLLMLSLLLCLSAACGRPGSVPAGPGAALRPHQDLYLEGSRSIGAIETPPPAQLAATTVAVLALTAIPPEQAAPFAVTVAANPQMAPIVLPPPRNRLVSADRSLDVAVGVYGDCSGNSPIDRGQADIDPCFGGRTYFVGHAPGVFAPLLPMGIGSLVTWYDAGAVAHPLRIVSRRDFRRNSATLRLSQPDVVAQFQTCLTADGAMDLILDAVRG